MASPIQCKTFYNRLTKCSYFEERNNYARNIRLIFDRILKILSKSDDSLLKIFNITMQNLSSTGRRFVLSKDRDEFISYCTTCCLNLNSFLSAYQGNRFLDKYVYLNKIQGNIGYVASDRPWNIHFSFKNAIDTQKELDFHQLNNYIYNKCKRLNNDCLVMSVPTDSYFIVEYKETDYTNLNKRGYIKSILNSRSRRVGEYCINCQKKCNPLFINGIERLVSST